MVGTRLHHVSAMYLRSLVPYLCRWLPLPGKLMRCCDGPRNVQSNSWRHAIKLKFPYAAAIALFIQPLQSRRSVWHAVTSKHNEEPQMLPCRGSERGIVGAATATLPTVIVNIGSHLDMLHFLGGRVFC